MNAINFSRMIIRVCLAFICLLWLGALTIRAANYYVRPPGTCTNTDLQSPYDNWDTAATNIQWAVNVATTNVPATVWVSNGNYCLTNQIIITTNITVKSTNGYANTFVYADWPTYTTRCFYVVNSGVVDGFTISNGHYWVSNAYNGGAGAFLSNATIQNCYLVKNICSNNSPSYGGGGGVFIKDSTVSNCIFVTNMAYVAFPSENMSGGAILSYSDYPSYILGCTIVSNWAGGRGGGIASGSGYGDVISNCTISMNYCGQVGAAFFCGYATVSDCVISNNNGPMVAALCYGMIKNCVIVNNNWGANGVNSIVVGYFNGAVLISNCNISGNNGAGTAVEYANYPTIVGCVLSNNINTSANYAGGVLIKDGAILRNCLICNNTNLGSGSGGGGLYLTNSALDRTRAVVINCTIANNYSTNEGGGIAAYGPSNYIVNCVIASNSSYSNNYPNVYHRDNVDANRSNFYYSCAVTTDAYLFAAGQGNITNDPRFADASAGNWRLGGNSPCFNRGTNQSWMTNAYDLNGQMRIRYGTVDMGAYERINEGTIYNFQ